MYFRFAGKNCVKSEMMSKKKWWCWWGKTCTKIQWLGLVKVYCAFSITFTKRIDMNCLRNGKMWDWNRKREEE